MPGRSINCSAVEQARVRIIKLATSPSMPDAALIVLPNFKQQGASSRTGAQRALPVTKTSNICLPPQAGAGEGDLILSPSNRQLAQRAASPTALRWL
jgi:hypothetical protein